MAGFVAVAMAAVAGSFLVSYTRAKAENLGLRGDVRPLRPGGQEGVEQRPEATPLRR